MHVQYRAPTLLTLTVGLLLSGCMTFEVDSNASITTESENGSEVVHGSIYGFKWRDYHVQKCDDGPLARVEYNFNWIELMAATFSLGLYVPQTVEWWCDDSGVEDDGDDPGLDPRDEFRE